MRQRLFSALLRLDAGRGLVLPFVEACLPHENRPEVLVALIVSWPPGLVCPETIWQQWCKKTQPPVNADEDDWDQQQLRQLAWKALFQLPTPERDPTGSPHWLCFLRQQLKSETSSEVLESIWDSLNQLGMWPTSAEERTAWLAELERHSPCGSKASDRFVARDVLLREAIIWRVLSGMHAVETDASVLSGELLSRYLSDYLKTPSCLRDGNDLSRLLKTMVMLPAMEHDHQAWLAAWEETGAMKGGSSVSRKAFWEVMVRAQRAGLYPAEETMEAAIRALGNETDFYVFSTAASWVPPAGRLQKLWADVWKPYLFSTFSYTAWRAWRPATDGYETFCSRLTEIPDEFRRTAAGGLLTWHRTEMTQERWHAWWAQWVRQESDLNTLEQLSREMRHWQPLPEVILSAWRERAQGGERDARVRWRAWWVLASQPVDLSGDIIRHLPCETDRIVLENMALWSPAATPVPADFWKGWGQKLSTLSSFSDDDRSFLLYRLFICCLKWRPATPDQIQQMWTMWERILPHCPGYLVKDTLKLLKLLSHAPFLAPPASPYLLNLFANEQYKFNDVVEILSTLYKDSAPSKGEWMQKISSFTGDISDPSWWEQQAEDMISQVTRYNHVRTTKLLSSAPFLAPPASPRLLNLVTNVQYEFNDTGRILSTVYKVFNLSEGELMEKISSFTGNISNSLWWEQQVEDMISEATEDYYTRTTVFPEKKDCLKSFQWICEHSPARRRGLLPGWNTLRPVLEDRSTSPEVELFFFSLVRKWDSPEGWQAWWEMAAARENRNRFVVPGGCCGMIRRLYLVERLAAGLSSCGEQADETTLRRLLRQMKQQWWRAEDVKLWQWLENTVNKAAAAGETSPFKWVGVRERSGSNSPWVLSSRRPGWESSPDATSLDATSSDVTSSGALPAHPFSPSLS